MPRRPRLHVAGGLYHVILRGNHRQPIFFEPSDRVRLEEILDEVVSRFETRVHAYCWMSNHIHLAMQVNEIPLGDTMRLVGSRYARYVQRRMPTTGHLFERRYRAILVDADSYLLSLVRYVHLNPVAAGLVADPVDYPWSSHRAYLGMAAPRWLTTELTLRTMSENIGSARAAYRRFIMAGLSGGGPSDTAFEEGGASDPRILGEETFICRAQDVPRRERAALDLETLIERICTLRGVETADLMSSRRLRETAQIRAIILWHATRRRIAPLSEVARRLGRAPSTLLEAMEQYRRADPGIFDLPPGVLPDAPAGD